MPLDVDPSGSPTSAQGFSAGGVYAGIKTYGDETLDVALLASDRPCTVAATFTQNLLHSASVDLNRTHLQRGQPRAVVVNAGCANSSTGQRGLDDAEQVTAWAGTKLGIDPMDVLVCSTGVIGHYLPMDKMRAGIAAIEPSPLGGAAFARAIMTTDTRPKHGSVRFGPYTLGGATKGSGMIHPNMATMLAFLATDAPVEQALLQRTLSSAVERSFNLLSIDGDTSPSDTAILFANGAAGGEAITASHQLAGVFAEAVETLCVYLAKEMARDGEGATKLIEFEVDSAATEAEARSLVRLLTTSYLLKSAVHGADPNWGRIVAVIGRSGVALSEAAVTVDVCGVRVFQRDQPADFDAEALSGQMKGETVRIVVQLGAGTASATGWGCDLSSDYVTINADYHT